MIPLSVLDLVPVGAGNSAAAAVHRVGDLARLAERLGYVRYWFAEHHGMQSVASAAPEILIGHVASATTRLRVGSGGIMLPNHAPLRIAEAFRTLSALHPGRIDLGIGRAPGSDQIASRALRAMDGGHFPQLLSDVLTLCGEMAFARLRRLPAQLCALAAIPRAAHHSWRRGGLRRHPGRSRLYCDQHGSAVGQHSSRRIYSAAQPRRRCALSLLRRRTARGG
jgi:luciferase family oxidoreductase group 1